MTDLLYTDCTCQMTSKAKRRVEKVRVSSNRVVNIAFSVGLV